MIDMSGRGAERLVSYFEKRDVVSGEDMGNDMVLSWKKKHLYQHINFGNYIFIHPK